MVGKSQVMQEQPNADGTTYGESQGDDAVTQMTHRRGGCLCVPLPLSSLFPAWTKEKSGGVLRQLRQRLPSLAAYPSLVVPLRHYIALERDVVLVLIGGHVGHGRLDGARVSVECV